MSGYELTDEDIAGIEAIVEGSAEPAGKERLRRAYDENLKGSKGEQEAQRQHADEDLGRAVLRLARNRREESR